MKIFGRWLLPVVFVLLLVLCVGFYFNQKKRETDRNYREIIIRQENPIEGKFGTLEHLSLLNLTLIKVQEKKDRWLVTLGYLADQKLKTAEFEVRGFNVGSKKYYRHGADDFIYKRGDILVMDLVYKSQTDQSSRQRLKDNLNGDINNIIGDFGDETISFMQIKERLYSLNPKFTEKEVQVGFLSKQL